MRLLHDLLRALRVAALALPLLLLAGWRTAGPKGQGYVVIVNAANPSASASKSDVMGKDAAAMLAYWQSQVFVGRTTPPPVKSGDAEVIAHVAAAAGGIGYVSPSAQLPETVKVLKVE